MAFGVSLLIIGVSCHSARKSIPSPKRGMMDSMQSNGHSHDSSSAINPGHGRPVPPSKPSPIELEKEWFGLLGQKDHLRGDFKLEGNWDITYNENHLASSVVMLVRPQQFMYISIRPVLGIEMARILFRPDSIWIINRFNENYWVGTWAELQPSIGFSLDYRWIQDALLHGHQSLIEQAVLRGVKPPVRTAIPRIQLENLQGNDKTVFEADWGQWPSKVHRLQIQSSGSSLKIDFLNVFNTENSSLPTHMTFALQLPRKKLFLEMHWNDPKLQEVSPPSVRIPKGYDKLLLN